MKKTHFLLAISLLLFACSKEDKSNEAEITDLSVTNLSNSDLTLKNIEINSETNQVYIFLDNDLSQFTFPISLTADIKLSSGAKTTSVENGELSFSNPDEIKTIEVEAEDGTLKNWYVHLIHHQIQNSHFEQWFDNMGMNGADYKEIGLSSVTSVWATANMGTSMFNVYCTRPLADGSNTRVEIETGNTEQVPITAGTLFTGIFDLSLAMQNPTDPKKATNFGSPFIFRPSAMKIKFKYQAGETYQQATVNKPGNILGGFTVTDIDGEDQCSIYAILENRSGSQVTEIGRAELNSGTTSDVLTETLIPFKYTSSEQPTHITVVFTSSRYGDLWKGAVGSTLIIDDLEFVYE